MLQGRVQCIVDKVTEVRDTAIVLESGAVLPCDVLVNARMHPTCLNRSVSVCDCHARPADPLLVLPTCLSARIEHGCLSQSMQSRCQLVN